MKIAVGMDLHSKMAAVHAVYAGNGEAKEKDDEFLKAFNKDFAVSGSSPSDMKMLAERLRGHDAHVLIENSTKSHETYWVLRHSGLNVTVAVAADLYRITKSVRKTDRNDSIELAGYMRRRLNGENEFAECYMPSLEWMMKRELCRTVFWEKLHLADLKRRTRAHLLLHGKTLSREYSDIFCLKAMEETDRMKDPCLRINNSEARSIKKRTDQEAKLIETVFNGNKMFDLIRSVPGFGLVSSAYLTSMIIDTDRFPSKERFAAYFGIVPKMRASANSNPNCSTTHRGDADARRLICQAAMVHIRVTDSIVAKMYHRLKGRGKAHKEALVACGRKLMTIVWSVIKSGRPFTVDTDVLKKADEEEEIVEEQEEF
ncbi:MAG: transposase [Methanomassiliicoccaceae archaeon]|nr:transposase [Methanomassiliicoccaceae archaeon]